MEKITFAGKTDIRIVGIMLLCIFGGMAFVGGLEIKDPPKPIPLQDPNKTKSSSAACGQKLTPPSGNPAGWSCSGNTATQIVPDGYYIPTYFGCSPGLPKDANDNCIPACGSIPECAGLSGRACEEKVQWFAANADQYGCNAKLKVTNPTTGKSVIVRAIDKGPACSVQSGRGKFDLSQAAYNEIGTDSLVQVEKVPESTPLGPVAACN